MPFVRIATVTVERDRIGEAVRPLRLCVMAVTLGDGFGKVWMWC